MQKEEFDTIIGFESDYDNYAMYERMYQSIDIDKNEFIKLLDITQIEKSERYLQAIVDNEKREIEARERIQDIKNEIKKEKEFCKDEYNSVYYIKIAKQRIKQLKNELQEIELINN